MKKILKLLVLFILAFSLKIQAQSPIFQEPVSNKNTHKGKKELKREMRIHRASERLATRNERKARGPHLSTERQHALATKKLERDRKKARIEEERRNKKLEKDKVEDTGTETVATTEKPKG